jgi:uncharacterized protein
MRSGGQATTAGKDGSAERILRTSNASATGGFQFRGPNLPGFEEATRALFARDQQRLEDLVHAWPEDVRGHLARLLERCIRPETEGKPSTADAPRASR